MKPETLAICGPRIYVMVSAHPEDARHLRASGSVPRHPLLGFALIDTGAQFTVVNTTLMEQLGIPIRGYNLMGGAGHAEPMQRARHAIGINLAPTGLPTFGCLAAAVPNPLVDKNIAIIGRDILSHFEFSVDGRTGEMMLAWNPEDIPK
jgi:hypothetical protein